MKRVYSRGSEVIHLFANLEGDERHWRDARNSSGNVYFQSGKLYSYGRHFELGRWVQLPGGDWVLLLTTAGSTVTTEKQKRELRFASSHIANRVELPESDSIERSLRAWCRELDYLAGKIARARKPELYTPGVDSIRRNFTLLAEFELIPQYVDRVANEIAAKLTELDESFNGAEFAAGVEKRQKAAKRYAARVEKAAIARDEKLLADWRLGVPGVHHFTPTSKKYAGLSFLRVAGEFIATSQNLRFPREVARGLYRAIESGAIAHLIDTKFDNRFTITSCDENYLVIGCHRIPRGEVDRIGELLGWDIQHNYPGWHPVDAGVGVPAGV